MKTVPGKLVSSKPVSLSKAAKILSGFAGHEHGASDAVSVYLHRAADAFNNLVSFHKELKNPYSYSKGRTSHVKIEENPDVGKVEIGESRSRGKSKKNGDFELKIEEQLGVEELRAGLVFEGNDDKDLRNKRKDEKDHKRKIKMVQNSYEVGEEMGEKLMKEKVKIEESMDIQQGTLDEVREKRKKKKHKKEKVRNEVPIKIGQSPKGESGDKERQVLEESGEGKKINRKGEEAGESVEIRKRKSRDVDGGETIALAEQSGKKKKRRKTEKGD